MFHMPIDTRTTNPSTFGQIPAFTGKPLQFPMAMDLCTDQAADPTDCDGLRLAAAARKSTSTQAFLPAFANADWRVFASFCVARRVQAGYRVMIPGRSDRALRFVVEGALWQESPVGNRNKVLAAGAIVGEDAVFSDAASDLDVRALEDSLVLELSLARQKELTASCPEIAFALLRAAGAVIAARGRPVAACDDDVVVAN